jgi:hypothetical protein
LKDHFLLDNNFASINILFLKTCLQVQSRWPTGAVKISGTDTVVGFGSKMRVLAHVLLICRSLLSHSHSHSHDITYTHTRKKEYLFMPLLFNRDRYNLTFVLIWPPSLTTSLPYNIQIINISILVYYWIVCVLIVFVMVGGIYNF